MIAEVFAAYMMCQPAKLDNKTDTWTNKDLAVMKSLEEKDCRERDPKNPCLYVFEKTAESEYKAMCGPALWK